MKVMGPTSATKRTGVDGVEVLAKGAATHAVALNGAHDDRLGQHHGHNALGVHKGRVAKVVQAVVAEDGGTSLEPGGAIACRAKAAGSEASKEEEWACNAQGTLTISTGSAAQRPKLGLDAPKSATPFFCRSSGTRQPSAPSMAQRAWMTSISR